MEDKLIFNLSEVKADLIVGISECNKRGLVHSGELSSCFHLFTFLFVFLIRRQMAR
jgi:hypothetical protein